MNSKPLTQRRRPPSKRQVTPEVYELIKRTHRVLKSNGVRVKADLWNPRGDGRTWIFIFEPTDKMPQSADPVGLVRPVLEAEGVEVFSVQKRENGAFGVAVCPSARGSRTAESPRSSQDSISELLREFDGLDPLFLTTPIPLSATNGSRHKLTPVTLEPPLEEMIGTALKQVRESFAGHIRGTLPLKTMPPETGIATNDANNTGVARAMQVEKIRREIYKIIPRLQLLEDYDDNIRGGKEPFSNFITVRVCDQSNDLCDKLCAIKTTPKPKIVALACEIAARANGNGKSVLPKTFLDAHKRYGAEAREHLDERK